MKWWGYEHESGTLQVKRYLDPRDMDDAHDSPFVKRVRGPFEANSREQALIILKEKLNAVRTNNKKYNQAI